MARQYIVQFAVCSLRLSILSANIDQSSNVWKRTRCFELRPMGDRKRQEKVPPQLSGKTTSSTEEQNSDPHHRPDHTPDRW